MKKLALVLSILFFGAGIPLAAQDCTPSATNLCLNESRFRVEVDWRAQNGNTGTAKLAPVNSDDSGLFWFFGPDNWEMLVKVLNGCRVNDHFWVFSAATTNIEYTLRVTDTLTHDVKEYFNPLGVSANAITDNMAFATCDAAPLMTPAGTAPKRTYAFPTYTSKQGNCTADSDTMCLNQERFRVEVDWADFQGNTGTGQVVPFGTDDSGLFWFFNADNWEMLVKVLDGCDVNGKFWVFAAATTNVEYNLKVTDTLTGATKRYDNPLGESSPAITDTGAFTTCSAGEDGLPPDPGPANDETIEGIDSDGDGIRDDIQRYIALNYSEAPTRNALTQITRSVQAALLDADSEGLSIEDAQEIMRASECLGAIMPTDERYRVKTLVLSEILDTELRGMRYVEFNSKLAGQVFRGKRIEEWATSCTFALPDSLQKQEADNSCSLRGGDTRVYFVNGVFNDYDKAVENCQVLVERVNVAFSPEEMAQITVDLAFNKSSVFLIPDLWEAYKQDVNTDYSQFYRMLAGIEAFPEFFRDTFLRIARTIEIWGAVGNDDLQNHLALYRDSIREGNKVIAVAHSQGNLFANQAYPLLLSEERQSFGIVSVANPDSFVAGQAGPSECIPNTIAGGVAYTTISEDRWIDSLGTDLIIDPLCANVVNGERFLGDFWRHAFADTYMLPGSPSLANIMNDIRLVRARLIQPNQDISDGVIKVTLTWGAEPDVDLHAFEPNGSHVYYANLHGQSGELDRDDVTSFGPEHYVVQCGKLEAGTYEIAVNYFAGSGPEVAQVLIQAGLGSRQFAIPLNESVGFSGDDSPIPVAKIVVSGNNQDGYEFQIQER